MPPLKTDYTNLRENLNSNFANRSDKAIEAIFVKYGVDAEAAEGFFSDLGKFAQKVAPSVLPVAGTVLGGVVGGPIGASLGGSLGSFAGQAIGGGSGQGPSAPQAPGIAGLLGGLGGSGAAGQLLQTVLNPSTIQALGSMALGPQLGKSSIPVGGASVPTGTFARLLGLLAGKMEAEYNEALSVTRAGVPEYMQDFAGIPKGDPSVADHRAAVLYELLEAERSEQEGAEGAEGSESELSESEMEALQAEYDAIELGEISEFA